MISTSTDVYRSFQVFAIAIVVMGFVGCQEKAAPGDTRARSNEVTGGRVAKTDERRTAETATANAKLSEREKIDLLLTMLEESNATFTRNGSEYSGSEAADHLRRKWRSAKTDLSADTFIETIASRSSTTGQDYQVRGPDGSIVTSGAWLRAKLSAIESSAPRLDGGSVARDAGAGVTKGTSSPPLRKRADRAADVLDILRGSDLTFLVTESDEIEKHSGRSLARRIEWKYRLSGNPTMSVPDFIETYCSRSSLHGTAYHVVTKNGVTLAVGDWLRTQVKD